MKSLSVVIAILLLLVTGGCGPVKYVPRFTHEDAGRTLLRFDSQGVLSNRVSLAHATEMLQTRLAAEKPVKRIVLMAHGWGYRAEDAESEYEEMIDLYCDAYVKSGGGRAVEDLYFIGVLWNSRVTGITDFIRGIDVSGMSPEILGEYVLEPILYPITYWSMASLADGIGHNSLRSALEDILDPIKNDPSVRDFPDIHAFGHSFGARIMNGLCASPHQYEALSFVGRGREPFCYLEHIRSLTLIAIPATPANVPGAIQDAFEMPGKTERLPFPVFATVNDRDYSQSFLFAIGNLLRNTSYGPFYDNQYRFPHDSKVPVRFMRGIAKNLSAVGTNALALIYEIPRTQALVLWRRHLHYVPDTLAQVPIVELLPEGVDKLLLGGRAGWGTRSRGLFEAGRVNTSVSYPTLWNQMETQLPAQDAAKWPRFERGKVYYVQATSLFKHGLMGYNMDRWYTYPLRVLDPKGSHSDFKRPDVFDLIVELNDRTDESLYIQNVQKGKSASSGNAPGK